MEVEVSRLELGLVQARLPCWPEPPELQRIDSGGVGVLVWTAQARQQVLVEAGPEPMLRPDGQTESTWVQERTWPSLSYRSTARQPETRVPRCAEVARQCPHRRREPAAITQPPWERGGPVLA